jgi:exoribonuclease R
MEFFPKFQKIESESSFDYGTIEKKEDGYYVNNILVENNRAIYKDIVYLQNNKVVNIKQRNDTLIVGILQLNNNTKYGFTKRNIPYFKFVPISNKYPPFIVPCKKKLLKQPYYLVIRFNKWESSNKHPIGKIEHYIGYVGDENNETNMLLYKNNIYPNKNKITYNDYSPNKNIDYNTISIDPDYCKDIDDALHIEDLGNNNYIIGIHIANVGEHVNLINTNTYSTIYLDNKQINMLADNETYNVYSLGEKTPKKSISLILEYNNYKLNKYYFKKSTVSNTPLSYNKAETLKETPTSIIHTLYNFTIKLLGLDKIKMTKLVEYYMILYNNLGAEILYKYDKNTILRTHDCNGTIDETNELSKYLSILNKNAAKYESNPNSTSHADLKLTYYSHITSPIRRHVDIINQINILNFLNNSSIVSTNYLEDINIFNKNLRKFYNNYKKLKLLYSIENNIEIYAYIININKNKLKIYIPSLEIEHSFIAISHKLLDSNKINYDDNYLIINDTKLNLYDKINIKLTPLVLEEKFNKKFNINILEPSLTFY